MIKPFNFKYGYTIFLIFLISNVFCQNESVFSVSGKVVDTDRSPVEFSIISLYTLSDSTIVDEVIQDADGSFMFNELMPNDYYLKIRIIGDDKMLVPFLKIEDRSVILDELIIDNSIRMDEVVIKSFKPALKRKADHVKLNVKDSYLSKSSFEVFEILNLIPNVNSSHEGVKIKNSSAILYLIDGRGNRRTNEVNKQRILNFTIDDIEGIEVYSNAPARFEADGASVLNVITTKNRKISSFRSFAKIGFLQNNPTSPGNTFSNSIDLNYKVGKLGLYSSLSFLESENIQTFLVESFYKQQDLLIENTNTQNNMSNGITGRIGSVYSINSQNEISFTYEITTNRFRDSSNLVKINELKYISNQMVDSVLSVNLRSGSGLNFNNINVGYWRKKKEYTFDIQFYFDNTSQSTSGIGFVNDLDDIYWESSDENNFSANSNYQDSILNNVDLRSGLKFSRTKSKEFLENTFNNGFFDYIEEIRSAYLELSGSFMDIDWQSGLRYEITSWQVQRPENRENSYSNLFPSLFLTKNFKNIAVNLSYTKRIQRQNISELNPLTRVRNTVLSTQLGSVEVLKPQFFDSYEINVDLPFMSLSTYLTSTKNPRIFFPNSIESNVISYLPQSVESESYIGFNVKIPFQFKFIRANFSTNSDIIKSSLLDSSTNTGYSNSLSLNLFSNLTEDITISAAARYRFYEKYSYYESLANLGTYIGFRYRKKNSPLTIRLNLNDIFGSNFNNLSSYPLFEQRINNVSFQRNIQLTLNYNFKLGREFDINSFDGKSR